MKSKPAFNREAVKPYLIHLLVFGLTTGFLVSHFKPAYLFSQTTTAGGDLSSQYLTAYHLIHVLLPNLKIIGWMPGNYAGFPLFQFYFPLPFVLMALINVWVTLEVAFKLVSILGVFLLPFCGYACLRVMRFPLHTQLLGAVFSLLFLFMEANSMWGGNIPSTLAGEFGYGIGFSLMFLYFGTFYSGITRGKWIRLNAVLLAAVGLCHGYTILFGVVGTLSLLFTTDRFGAKAWYYLKVNALSFFLLGFWIVQLLWFTPYTTSNNFIWTINSIGEVIPPILTPAAAAAVLGSILTICKQLKKRRQGKGNVVTESCYQKYGSTQPGMDTSRAELFLWVVAFLAVVFFFIAHRIGVVDIRFLPFFQYSLVLLGAVGTGKCLEMLKARGAAVLLLAIIIPLGINSNIQYIPDWIRWNYSGFEGKKVWPQFKQVNKYLSGDVGDPRVVYEHHARTESAGSLRAFEMLPYFSGRSTLEGLYMQSSPTAPFVFYIQSELSKTPSRPFPQYSYSRMRIERALEHLKLFNVSHIIAVGDKLKSALTAHPETDKEKEFPPFSIYRYKGNVDRYVTLTKKDPVLLVGGDWKQQSFRWFRIGDLNSPVVFKKHVDPGDEKRFDSIYRDLLPERFFDKPFIRPQPKTIDENDRIHETLNPETIRFQTPHIGKPHLIRVSYHPNWKVEGADRVYLVSPSFMLVYPQRSNVRLYFSATFPNHLGRILTIAGLVILFFTSPMVMRLMSSRCPALSARISFLTNFVLLWGSNIWTRVTGILPVKWHRRILLALLALMCLSTAALVTMVHNRDAVIMYKKGIEQVKQGQTGMARQTLQTALHLFPGSSVADETAFYHGLTYYKEENWTAALRVFNKVLSDFPDARIYSEILFHTGKCYVKLNRSEEAAAVFNKVIADFPDEVWAEYSKEWLQKIK